MGRTFSKHVDDDTAQRWEVFEKDHANKHPKRGRLVGAALELFMQLPSNVVDEAVWNGPDGAFAMLIRNLALRESEGAAAVVDETVSRTTQDASANGQRSAG